MSADAELSFLPSDVIEYLHASYSEPQRHYHTWTHIEELFERYHEFSAGLSDLIAVKLALAFHDVVYDPRRGDNEDISAASLDASDIGDVQRVSVEAAVTMIEATKAHALPKGDLCNVDDAAYFLDADLSILGANQARFEEYEAQIRNEYAFVPGEAFTVGRRAILKRFLDRPTLYYTDWGRSRFEATAKENLSRSLAKVWQ